MSLPKYLEPLYCHCGTTDRSGQSCRCEDVCVVCKDDQAVAIFDDRLVCLPCGERAHERNNLGMDPLEPDPEPLPAIDLQQVFA